MKSRYEIVEDIKGKPLVIRDIGPWDEHRSVTNDAENVVQRLVYGGFLPPGRRLFYYDSIGDLDEILVEDGRFAGFKPGPDVIMLTIMRG